MADVAKLSGGRFRTVLSAEDRMYCPLNAASLTDSLEKGRSAQVAFVDGPWQDLTSPARLAQLVQSNLRCGLQLAQALAPPVAQSGLLLSDASGKIEQLMLQCPGRGSAEALAPAWSRLSEELSAEAKMVVTVPPGKDGQEVQDYLLQHVAHPEKMQFLTNAHPSRMSVWSRDSVLPVVGPDGQTTLVVPLRRSWAGSNPEQDTADINVPWLMAGSNLEHPVKAAPQLWVSVDGGNVVSNATTAFVGSDSLRNTVQLRAEQGKAASEEEALQDMQDLFGKNIVILNQGGQAAFHVDLYCTPLGEKKVLVGDPGLALKILDGLPPKERYEAEKSLADKAELMRDGLFDKYRQAHGSPEAQSRYDEVAAQLEGLGFEVERIPCLPPGKLGHPSLSYNNVLVEEYDEVKKVYLPQYDCPPLDQAASALYQSLGYTVVPLPLTELSKMQGALRCSALPTNREFG